MDFDDLLFRYFASRDLTQVPPEALEAGIERAAWTSGCRGIAGTALRSGACFTGWAPRLTSTLRSKTGTTARPRAA